MVAKTSPQSARVQQVLRKWLGNYGFTEEGVFIHQKAFRSVPTGVVGDLQSGTKLELFVVPSPKKKGSFEGQDVVVVPPDACFRSSSLHDDGHNAHHSDEKAPVSKPQLSTSSNSSAGFQYLPLVLLTGRPGVGKSTVIKRIAEACGCVLDGTTNSREGSGKPKGPSPQCSGFFTEELRVRGQRVGFSLKFFGNQPRVPQPPPLRMAHVDIPKTHAVGKYGVDLSAVGEAAAYLGQKMASTAASDTSKVDSGRVGGDKTLLLLDEIGKMECLSPEFVRVVRQMYLSPQPPRSTQPLVTIATIALNGPDLIAEMKKRPELHLVEITEHNRENAPEQILELAASLSSQT